MKKLRKLWNNPKIIWLRRGINMAAWGIFLVAGLVFGILGIFARNAYQVLVGVISIVLGGLNIRITRRKRHEND